MDNQSRVIGKLGSTPIIVRGLTWLPLAQLATFLGMIWYRHHRSPERPPGALVASAAMTTNAILGSEWAHNLAHLVVAHRLRKPMDELQIILGMPRCIYYDLEDIAVTPRQHILRALAGPLFNASLLPLLKRLRQTSPPGSVAHDLWDAALGMNLFLATVSLLPIPGIDGGPILKWTLVEYGQNPQQADQIVRRLNGPLAVLLGLGGLLAYLRKKRFIAVLLGLLSGTALGVFLGWIQESEILQSPRAQTGKLT